MSRCKQWEREHTKGYVIQDMIEFIFPELAESEDERIRKEIVDFIRWAIDRGSITKEQRERSDTWLAYLEKQKPSAEEVLIKAGLKPYKDGNQWCILIGDNIQEGICGFGDTIDDALYHLLREAIAYQKEQKPANIPSAGSGAMGTTPPAYKLDVKPAEWSEEDKKYLNQAINIVVSDFGEDSPTVLWLKSLRPQPHWKPSEEQMDALKNSAYGTYQNGDGPALRELYEQLKKL